MCPNGSKWVQMGQCVMNICICICICKYLSKYSYLYSYSPLFVTPNKFLFVFAFFINPNIFIFVLTLHMETKFISIFISEHKFHQLLYIAYYGTYLVFQLVQLLYTIAYLLEVWFLINICLCICIWKKTVQIYVFVFIFAHFFKLNFFLYLRLSRKLDPNIFVFIFAKKCESKYILLHIWTLKLYLLSTEMDPSESKQVVIYQNWSKEDPRGAGLQF